MIRDAGPRTPAVHALLRQLVGSGRHGGGREALTYIDGELTQPGSLPWGAS